MKRYFYIAAALMILLTCCDNKEPQPVKIPAVCGEWKSTDLSVDIPIYISFNQDESFELYQKTKTDGYDLYMGKWAMEDVQEADCIEGVLSGNYNDHEPWAYSYRFIVCKDTINVDNPVDTLKLKTLEDDGMENIFISCEIPEVIKETAEVVVKGGSDGCCPIL